MQTEKVLHKGTVMQTEQVLHKGTVMQTEQVLINDPLCVPRVSWKFYIPTIYNIALLYPWNLLFS